MHVHSHNLLKPFVLSANDYLVKWFKFNSFNYIKFLHKHNAILSDSSWSNKEEPHKSANANSLPQTFSNYYLILHWVHNLTPKRSLSVKYIAKVLQLPSKRSVECLRRVKLNTPLNRHSKSFRRVYSSYFPNLIYPRHLIIIILHLKSTLHL